MERQLTLGSLFDGIAGFPLAAVRQGIKPVWASEIEQDCVDITAKQFPDMQQLGDITKLKGGRHSPGGYYQFWKPVPEYECCRGRNGACGGSVPAFL